MSTIKLSLDPKYAEHLDIDLLELWPGQIKNLKRLMGPGIYAVFGNVGALYIGSAKNILARISEESHHSFRKALGEGQVLTIGFAKGEAHARALETYLIQVFQPKYNIRGRETADLYFARDFEIAFKERLETICQTLSQ